MQIRKTRKTFSLVSEVCKIRAKDDMISEKTCTIKISQAVYIETAAKVLWGYLLNCPGITNGRLKDKREPINLEEILLRKESL